MITRRLFLKNLFGIAAAVVVVPSLIVAPVRQPWVKEGEIVDWIGRCGESASSFCGGRLVKEIRPWTGKFYPVVASLSGDPLLYSDEDLACFNREVPDGFWGDEINGARYPNVHTFVRMQRYGENIVQAIRALNFAHTEEWVQRYGRMWKCV